MKSYIDIFRLHPLKKRIFFLHVPKCAGMSFFQALSNSYGLYPFRRRQAVVYLDAAAALQGAQTLDVKVYDFREQLLAYFMAQPLCLCIGGHFSFSQTLYEEFSSDWNYVTVIRDPVELWFSHYTYLKKTVTPNHPWKQYADLNIEEFLETPAGAAMGHSFITALTNASTGTITSDPEATEQALARLKLFSLLGTVENLSDFADRFYRKFGARIRIPHINRASPSDNKQKQLPSFIKERVMEICRPNQQIYDAVCKQG